MPYFWVAYAHTRMKVLIIEDDTLAADFIEKLISDNFKDFEVVGKATTVVEASAIYMDCQPDLLIMDINLGDHTSFDLFEYINPSQLNVIFTSSYQEFALKAIKVDAVDYLLKPVNIEDFKLAIKKVREKILNGNLRQSFAKEEGSVQKKTGGNKMLLYEGERLIPIDIEQIIKVRSMGSYTNIFIEGNKVLTSTKNLRLYEKLLEDRMFLRIHDVCLVNSVHISGYMPGIKAYVILSDDSIEMVSKRKKKDFLNFYFR